MSGIFDTYKNFQKQSECLDTAELVYTESQHTWKIVSQRVILCLRWRDQWGPTSYWLGSLPLGPLVFEICMAVLSLTNNMPQGPVDMTIPNAQPGFQGSKSIYNCCNIYIYISYIIYHIYILCNICNICNIWYKCCNMLQRLGYHLHIWGIILLSTTSIHRHFHQNCTHVVQWWLIYNVGPPNGS